MSTRLIVGLLPRLLTKMIGATVVLLSIVSVDRPELRVHPPGVFEFVSAKFSVPRVTLRSRLMGTASGTMGARSMAVKLATSFTPLGTGLPNSHAPVLLQEVPPEV